MREPSDAFVSSLYKRAAEFIAEIIETRNDISVRLLFTAVGLHALQLCEAGNSKEALFTTQLAFQKAVEYDHNDPEL